MNHKQCDKREQCKKHEQSEKHEQLNLIYYAQNEPQINYFISIPESESYPRGPKKLSSGINTYTTPLYDINNRDCDIGLLISTTTIIPSLPLQNCQINTFVFSLTDGTMTFGFTLFIANDVFNYSSEVINLNFLYGSGKYQNANVKSATLTPVDNINQARVINIEFDN